MPRVTCDLTECKFNHSGECDADEIDLDYTATCSTYEQKRGIDANRE